ncbi:hypothetical protein J2X63_002038 [Agromyces sp. 3263]|uniref:hypothetical protein n=1 Tax=Agromyces sp. 3263 TaxID=2817750 RepID=UPI00286394E1|nr:hypothetical protein [Agromyces sp. 3263]MDR6906352.1 hypothetical protein [Agromyces sp. 3263]
MTTFTDDDMRAELQHAQPYTAMLLRAGPKYGTDGADRIIWEHGRRNFELRADGRLAIVLPVRDDSELAGLAVFALSADETAEVMRGDPAVQAGVLEFELHPVVGFPGDALP